jgi:NADPH-dependent curcumin reductase CurA
VEIDVPPPAKGQVQVRNLWMSVDPYMRNRMNKGASYVPPFQLGQPLQGGAVGEVIVSEDSDFRPGDLVMSMLGWRELFNVGAGALQKIDPDGLPPQLFLGLAGMPGLTAYIGLCRIARAKAQETVFVSAAAGAVGSAACQIALINGCKVIGSAGGSTKIEFLREIGVDQTIDYKASPDLAAVLARAAPSGIDIYFDNVGGPHLEAALANSRPFGRIVLCGSISQTDRPARGPSNIGIAVSKRLTLQGFIVSDHLREMAGFVAEMGDWIKSGRIKWRETVDRGIESAPAALLKLFAGENVGKMLVKLA